MGLPSAPRAENARERKAITTALRAGESGWNVEGRASIATGYLLLVFLLGSRASRETLPLRFPRFLLHGYRRRARCPAFDFVPVSRVLVAPILLFRGLRLAGAPRRSFVKSAAPVSRSTRVASGAQPFRLTRPVDGLAEGRAGRFAALGKLRDLGDG